MDVFKLRVALYSSLVLAVISMMVTATSYNLCLPDLGSSMYLLNYGLSLLPDSDSSGNPTATTRTPALVTLDKASQWKVRPSSLTHACSGCSY
jgi:hypothetical protein